MRRFRLLVAVFLCAVVLSAAGCKGLNPFKKSKKLFRPTNDKPKHASLQKRVKRLARKGRKGLDSLLGRERKPSAPSAPIENILAQSRRGYAYGPAPEYSERELKKAAAYADLLFGRQSYENRQAILERLVRQPDPGAQAALIMILSTRTDPLSPLAIEALLQLGGKPGLRAIREAINDPRPSVQAPALLAYVRSGRPDAAGFCRKLLSSRSPVELRAIAALGLGELKVTASADDLRRAAATDFPTVRLCAAWALWRMGDSGGRAFLDRLAASNDPTLAPQAISFLYAMGDPASIPSLLLAMDSPHNAIWIPAFQTLLALPPEQVREGITLRQPFAEKFSPNETRRTVLLKLALALAVAETQGPDSPRGELFPGRQEQLELRQALLRTSQQDNLQEKLLMASLLKKWHNPTAIEPLIRTLASQDEALRAACGEALRAIADKDYPGSYPQEDRQIPWRRWWLKNCKAASVRDAASGKIVPVIKAPDGNNYFAAPELEIVPGVVVGKIAARKNPLSITLFFNNQRYELSSDKTGAQPE